MQRSPPRGKRGQRVCPSKWGSSAHEKLPVASSEYDSDTLLFYSALQSTPEPGLPLADRKKDAKGLNSPFAPSQKDAQSPFLF